MTKEKKVYIHDGEDEVVSITERPYKNETDVIDDTYKEWAEQKELSMKDFCKKG